VTYCHVWDEATQNLSRMQSSTGYFSKLFGEIVRYILIYTTKIVCVFI